MKAPDGAKYGPKAQRKYDSVHAALTRAGRPDAHARKAAEAACAKMHDAEEAGDWREQIDEMD